MVVQTILYIEDDPASRLLVERALTHMGYRVLLAERGLDGIDMARRESPDLILTDINLPDLSGREITTTLRREARFERTPIVALTAQGEGEHRALTMAAGATGYLTKPVDVEQLMQQVDFYLSGGKDQIDSATFQQAQTRYTQEIVQRLETQIRDLQSTNHALTRLDKMKDSFIQVTAHELRTPMTLVYGYSKLLAQIPDVKQAVEADANLAQMMHGLDEGIRRMQDIINEILTISRIMTNQIDLSIGMIRLSQVAERAVARVAEAAKLRQVTLHDGLVTAQERVPGDFDLLVLLLTNLLGNAIKYTPDGGQVHLGAQQQHEVARLWVRDTGIGIAREEQERIFERFHTASDTRLHSTSKTAFRGGGLGLGLAICKGIVEAHGGRIWVESPGYDEETCPGSTFWVELPLISRGGTIHKL
jgi:signal transduction histidine kinase